MGKEKISGLDWVKIIDAMAAALTANQDELSSLDGAIGDGDHGINMVAAMNTAAKQIHQLQSPLPGTVLQQTGSTMMNEIGGASGMVFGAFFLGCGRLVNGAEYLTKEDVETMLIAGLAQVQKRGKAQVGDKTMVDALAPALAEYQKAIASGFNLGKALEKAAAGACEGAQSTRDMVAHHGRAKFLGDRSLGHQDAGATSMAIIFTAWSKAL